MIPSIRGLVVVDAEGFSRHRDAQLPSLHTEIRRAVAGACERSGLRGSWQGARVLQSTGDGLFAVLPHEALVKLIHPFTDSLQDILADAAPRLRSMGMRLRLRVALHAGLVGDEDPETAGVSTATNDLHRLLDCEPLRAALRNSDPEVTFAASILSSEVFDLFVRGGHTDLQPSQFATVQAQVKQFDRPAYLYVPRPSAREVSDEAVPHTPEHEDCAPPAGLSMGHVSVTGDAAQNVIGNQVHGSIRQKRS
jgi:hypothetical protein